MSARSAGERKGYEVHYWDDKSGNLDRNTYHSCQVRMEVPLQKPTDVSEAKIGATSERVSS